MSTTSPARLPTYFVSHGGGPWPWIKDMMPGDMSALETSLRSIPAEIGTTPRAVLVVSGHWETPDFTVQTHPNPPMLYDYGGFPDFTYQIQYPAPGSPEIAQRVVDLLRGASIVVDTDADRGFDHGVFAPLYVTYPDADVPMFQLSIRRDFDPEAHLAVGRALAPLRDEGVLILASGLPSYHDLSRWGSGAEAPSREFDSWLTTTLVDQAGTDRTQRLTAWADAPSARLSHPREDHFIPGLVAVGAAEDEPGFLQYHEADFMGSIHSSSYRFGAARSN